MLSFLDRTANKLRDRIKKPFETKDGTKYMHIDRLEDSSNIGVPFQYIMVKFHLVDELTNELELSLWKAMKDLKGPPVDPDVWPPVEAATDRRQYAPASKHLAMHWLLPPQHVAQVKEPRRFIL